MNKKIIIISQYFYPENFRINDIADELVKRGHDVTVITGIPNYPTGSFFEGYSWLKRRTDARNGVRIVRLPIVPRGKSSLSLGLNYVSFVFTGWLWKQFNKSKADAIFTYEVSPMTQALIGVWLSKKTKAKNLLYVMDLWPENVEVVTGVKNRRILNLIQKMSDYIYHQNDVILTSSQSFKNSIEKRNVAPQKVVFWPQYAEEIYIPKVSKEKLTESFTITFAGNLGEGQGLDILLPVAQKLKANKADVVFYLIGQGRYKETMMHNIQELGIDDLFVFHDPIPAEVVADYLGKSDMALITLKSSLISETTIPAKFQSYIACKIPIIASVDGELSAIINDAQCGFVSPTGDAEALYENIMRATRLDKEQLSRLASNGYEYSKKHYDKKMLMDKLETLMEN